MSFRTTADNKFGLSPWIVGTTLGDGCNYVLIQDAINDCFTAGGGVVFIRAGAYTENITIPDGVTVSGLLNTTLSSLPGFEFLPVTINGTVTFTGSTGRLASVTIFLAAPTNVFVCASGSYSINNVTVAPLITSPYLFDITPPCNIYIEASNLIGDAVFTIADSAGLDSVAFVLEDSTVAGELGPSVIGDNIVFSADISQSIWLNSISGAGSVNTQAILIANASEFRGSTGLVAEADTISMTGEHSSFIANSSDLFSATTVVDFVMRHCSIFPFSFPIPFSSFGNLDLKQCDITQNSTSNSEIYRGLPGGSFTGTYSERFHGTAQTTDATPTTLAVIPLRTNEVVSITANIAAATPAFDGQAGGDVRGIARRAGGGAVLGGTFSDNFAEGTIAAATSTVVVVGNNALLRVTGVLGQTINWSVDYTVLHSQTNT